jgi:hypothetical protein
MSLALFALVIFQIGSHIYIFLTQASLDLDSPIYTFHIAGMTGMCYHTQLLLVEMESCELFA